ncbi:putative JmjC domain-containing histone demethylation protein 2C [Caerostris extrusa]|uniref:JmjC domain-containing histone demethylation protein 2C n=1 Tax=Caerostris extrusa TaxID=172846 RepID=A0AAV4NNL9_CAEEX|nr:putative JmjC domain-containing histone demethylation protein 2C [Caerostris extrusa]
MNESSVRRKKELIKKDVIGRNKRGLNVKKEKEFRERQYNNILKSLLGWSYRNKKALGWSTVSNNKTISKVQESSPTNNLQASPVIRNDDRLRDQEKERTQYLDSNHAHQEHERWLVMVQQQRNEQPANSSLQNFSVEPRSVRNTKSELSPMAGHVSSKSNLAPSPVGSSVSQLKNETNFSLYGYQPFQHTYITHAQLKAREETKVSGSTPPTRAPSSGHQKTNIPQKSDKDNFIERPLTPGSSHVRNQSSSKHQLKMMHLGQDRGAMIYQPLVGSGGAFKPYEYSINGSSPAPPAHQSTSSAINRIASSHYQQLQDQPQNLVKTDNKGIQEKVNVCHKYDPRDNTKSAAGTTNALPARFSPPYASSKSTSPAANSSYSYSLIQQGLVPNPMYIAATHAGNINSSTPPVSFVHSQSSSKGSIQPESPTASQQYPHASPNSGIISGSPVCRPNSVPYTLPHGRMGRSYSPVGPLSLIPGNASSGKIIAHDSHLSNRAHITIQGSSHRSPSPAHLYGTQLNSGAPNSPHQSSPRLASVSNHPSLHLSIYNPSSPFHSNSQSENLETTGIPLVKRKLVNDVTSRKRPKSIDDSLLPPQLQPQVQASCMDTNETQIITPPHLVSNVPLLAEHHLSTDSFSVKSNPSSPAVACNLSYKLEPAATPPSMPDLRNSPLNQIEPRSDLDNSLETQNYFCSLSKYKIPNRNTANTFEDSAEFLNNQASNISERTAILPNTPIDSSEEQLNNVAVLPVASSSNSTNSSNVSGGSSSSSSHPKLKKAWLQRHSENEDKKFPNDIARSIKVDPSCDLKCEYSETFLENCKPEPFVLIENSICDKYIENVKVKSNDSESDASENKPLKSESVLEDDYSSSGSDVDSFSKHRKRKSKSKKGKRSKAGNSTDVNSDDQISSPKKDKKKETSIHSRKRGRKSKGRNAMLEVTCKKKGNLKTRSSESK